MNNRALTLSLAMAVIAVFFVQSYVTSIEDEAKKKFGTEFLVLKAKKDIKEQETLTDGVFDFDPVPEKFLEPSAVSFRRSTEEKETEARTRSIKQLAGAIALVPIKKGEQITFSKITEPSIRTGLAPQVAPGRRAVSIPVNETSGVSKLVKPGDRVDLIGVIDAGAGKENKIARVLLQDVVVLAVGKNVTNNAARLIETDPNSKVERVRSLSEDTTFTAVTLEVAPQEAQMLALIVASGDSTLSLALRNNDDSDRGNIPGVMMGDVLGQDGNRLQRGPAGGGRR